MFQRSTVYKLEVPFLDKKTNKSFDKCILEKEFSNQNSFADDNTF